MLSASLEAMLIRLSRAASASGMPNDAERRVQRGETFRLEMFSLRLRASRNERAFLEMGFGGGADAMEPIQGRSGRLWVPNRDGSRWSSHVYRIYATDGGKEMCILVE